MRIKAFGLVFTTRWSDDRRRPSIIWHLYPKPSFVVGISFWGWAIVRRDWWNKWTDFGRLAV